jgi:Rrf2 family protein
MSQIVQVSGAAALAIHGLWRLAATDGKIVHIRDIADSLGVSVNHLAKVFQWLGKSGLVEAERGPLGGVRLAKQAARITLLEIVEAIEGPVEKGSCLFKRGQCGLSGCILGEKWARLNDEMLKYFEETTLDKIADNQDKKEARHGKTKNRKN